jgi:hypothetical protein
MRKLIFVFSLAIIILSVNNFVSAAAVDLIMESETSDTGAAATSTGTEAKDFGLSLMGGNEIVTNISNQSLSFLGKAGKFFSRVPDYIMSGFNFLYNLSANINISPVNFLINWLKQIIQDIGSGIYNISALSGFALDSATDWLGKTLMILGALILLITAGFILIKLFKIPLLRKFLLLGLVGAVIIISLFLGARYVISSLLSNISQNKITEIGKTVEQEVKNIDASAISQELKDKTGSLADSASSTVNSAKGWVNRVKILAGK